MACGALSDGGNPLAVSWTVWPGFWRAEELLGVMVAALVPGVVLKREIGIE